MLRSAFFNLASTKLSFDDWFRRYFALPNSVMKANVGKTTCFLKILRASCSHNREESLISSPYLGQ